MLVGIISLGVVLVAHNRTHVVSKRMSCSYNSVQNVHAAYTIVRKIEHDPIHKADNQAND